MIQKVWGKSGARVDEVWYRQLIAKAIIFRRLEKLVSAQEWYEGGYRANIVTYAIAKVAHDAEAAEKQVDLQRVWRMQTVPPALEEALLVAAAEAQSLITSPPEGIRNMSEWAKKQACWERFRKTKLDYPEDFKGMLIAPEEARSEDDAIKDDVELTKSVEDQTRVFELGPKFWDEARNWGRSHKLLTPMEYQVLGICAKIPDRIPTENQTAVAIKALAKLESNGFGITEKATAGE